MKELTINQLEIRRGLGEQFNIDPERILFLNEGKPEEPWLPAEALMTIARQSGNFKAIDESVDQFIEPLRQIVHRATVIDVDGRSYTRCGVATLGERGDVDDHALAAGRALNAALTAAGFNPLRPGAVVTLDLNLAPGAPHVETTPAGEAQARTIDLKRIHVLAAEKGLIKHLRNGEKDARAYRQMLKERFGVSTVIAMNQAERASVVNYIQQLPDVDEFAAEEFAGEVELATTS